jgi:surfeit locus 1 family protein
VSRYRFALRPMWILSHLLVLAVVVSMVNLGLWQLRRLDERREFNRLLEANVAAEPVAVADVLGEAPAPGELAGLEWRRVATDGSYRQDADVLVANRTLDGQPGAWIVSPLAMPDGSTIAVMRGFVPLSVARSGNLAGAEAPSGRVAVVGLVQESREGGRFARDRGGQLPEVSRLDLGALAERWGVELAPFWLHLVDQQPAAAGGVLRPVPPPDVDAGPHLGYAVQWFIFGAIAVIGYPLVLRRTGGAGGVRPPASEDPAGEPPPTVAANGAGARGALR